MKNRPTKKSISGWNITSGCLMHLSILRFSAQLRGYENQSITPGRDSRGTANPEPYGGVVYNKYVMEMRYLVSPNPSATIFVLAFAEAGNNWGSYKDFNPYDLKKSAGAGARIFMPAFGLLGIDWGYGFDAIPGSTQRSGSQFHFTIGQQIR